MQVVFIVVTYISFHDADELNSFFSYAVQILTLIGSFVYIFGEYLQSGFNIVMDGRFTDSKFYKDFKKFKELRCSAFIHVLLIFAVVYFCSLSLKLFYYTTIRGDSGTTINVYGMGKATVNNDSSNITLWDAVDIAVPAEENVVAFITTKRVTIHQTLGNCGETRRIQEAHCTSDANCTADIIYKTGHGITTGSCLNDTCEVFAWCPIEPVESDERVTVEKLVGVGEYTLHVRNYVHFNLADGNGKSYNNSVPNNSCVYNETKEDHCPILSLEYIMKKVQNKTGKLLEFPPNGAIVTIHIQYDCYKHKKICQPIYNFTLIESNSSGLANYSFTDVKYPYGNKNSRNFIKATGLLFLVEVDATMKVISQAEALAASAAVFVVLESTEFLINLVLIIIFPFYCCVGSLKKKSDLDDSSERSHTEIKPLASNTSENYSTLRSD